MSNIERVFREVDSDLKVTQSIEGINRGLLQELQGHIVDLGFQRTIDNGLKRFNSRVDKYRYSTERKLKKVKVNWFSSSSSEYMSPSAISGFVIPYDYGGTYFSALLYHQTDDIVSDDKEIVPSEGIEIAIGRVHHRLSDVFADLRNYSSLNPQDKDRLDRKVSKAFEKKLRFKLEITHHTDEPEEVTIGRLRKKTVLRFKSVWHEAKVLKEKSQSIRKLGEVFNPEKIDEYEQKLDERLAEFLARNFPSR